MRDRHLLPARHVDIRGEESREGETEAVEQYRRMLASSRTALSKADSVCRRLSRRSAPSASRSSRRVTRRLTCASSSLRTPPTRPAGGLKCQLWILRGRSERKWRFCRATAARAPEPIAPCRARRRCRSDRPRCCLPPCSDATSAADGCATSCSSRRSPSSPSLSLPLGRSGRYPGRRRSCVPSDVAPLGGRLFASLLFACAAFFSAFGRQAGPRLEHAASVSFTKDHEAVS